jgi:hypothetical protein
MLQSVIAELEPPERAKVGRHLVAEAILSKKEARTRALTLAHKCLPAHEVTKIIRELADCEGQADLIASADKAVRRGRLEHAAKAQSN